MNPSPIPRHPRPAEPAEALRSLHALARSLALGRALDRTALPKRIEVRFDLDLERPPTPEAARSLLDHLAASVEQAIRASSALRFGRVFCFFCASSCCPHASPREPDEVFAGYQPTGRPRWIDLPTLFLERRDPRVDSLYDRSRLVALVEEGRLLKSEQIAEFGRDSGDYDVLGQAVAGFFETGEAAGRRENSAVTFQVVRTDRGDGRLHLHLNAVSAGRMFDDAGAALDSSLGRILAIARRRLASMEREIGGALRRGARASEVAERALSILRALARDLEHNDRAGSRRTRHGRSRSDLGVRPTPLAFPEAREAPDERFFEDERARTFIVLGRAGRIHVFTPQARHVTSFVHRGDEIDRRLRTGRWKRAPAASVAAFRRALEGEGRPGRGGG